MIKTHIKYIEFIVNDYFRSDIREINSIDDVKEIHNKIISQLNKIISNDKLYEHSLNYFKKWPYKFTCYDVKKIIKAVTPMKIFGSPDDIAWAAVYLASDESKFVTGQTISPNGGFVMSQ